MNTRSDAQFNRFLDIARRAVYRYEAQFTRFLDPVLEIKALEASKDSGVMIAFFGGYPDAERRMACFYVEERPEEWPLQCLKIGWKAKYAEVGHRDLLGAVMAQGMARECIGDIVIDEDTAYLFATTEAADWIKANLDSAGRAKLCVEYTGEGFNLPPPKGVIVRETVVSMRLDAVVAAAFSLPRAEARQLVERGSVRLNHVQQSKADAYVMEEDLISVRGYGRFRIVEEQGETRKGRIGVRLFRYGA